MTHPNLGLRARATRTRAIRLAPALWLIAAAVAAQTNRGGIAGTVFDPLGAVVPGATVVVTNVGTSKETRTTTSGSGTFSATCMGNVQVNGSASGSINGNTITWSATATGTVPNLPPCQIMLSGTATLEANNKIRIPYAGTTCLGPVSGTEVIQK